MNYSSEESGPPVTEADVCACEQGLGVSFPEDYRAFLLACNGGTPHEAACVFRFRHPFRRVDNEPNCLASWISIGGEYDLVTIAQNLADFLPPGFIAVGEAGSNTAIIMSCRERDRGNVFYINLNYYEDGSEPDIILGRSFAEFFAKLEHYRVFEESLEKPEESGK